MGHLQEETERYTSDSPTKGTARKYGITLPDASLSQVKKNIYPLLASEALIFVYKMCRGRGRGCGRIREPFGLFKREISRSRHGHNRHESEVDAVATEGG